MLLLALDGNSIVNRAFYGVRPLTTRDGLYTNAIYGFLNILQKLLDETKPEALCVTFDKKAPTFRHLAYADYKGTRKPMPEELAMQMLNDACPNDQVIKLKALEAMQKIADGKATKIIIPSELQGFAGLASGIAESVKETK